MPGGPERYCAEKPKLRGAMERIRLNHVQHSKSARPYQALQSAET